MNTFTPNDMDDVTYQLLTGDTRLHASPKILEFMACVEKYSLSKELRPRPVEKLYAL
jgi:hypothetical protein